MRDPWNDISRDYLVDNYPEAVAVIDSLASALAVCAAERTKAKELLDDVWRSYSLIGGDQAHLDHSMEAVVEYLFPAAPRPVSAEGENEQR